MQTDKKICVVLEQQEQRRIILGNINIYQLAIMTFTPCSSKRFFRD